MLRFSKTLAILQSSHHCRVSFLSRNERSWKKQATIIKSVIVVIINKVWMQVQIPALYSRIHTSLRSHSL